MGETLNIRSKTDLSAFDGRTVDILSYYTLARAAGISNRYLGRG